MQIHTNQFYLHPLDGSSISCHQCNSWHAQIGLRNFSVTYTLDRGMNQVLALWIYPRTAGRSALLVKQEDTATGRMTEQGNIAGSREEFLTCSRKRMLW